MAKKSATYLEYEVIVEDNGSITVKKGGQVLSNVMGAIREIASVSGYEINEKSNTRQNGAKLVDYLKALPASGTQSAPAPAEAPKPKAEPEKAGPAPAAPKQLEEPAKPAESAPKAAPAPKATPAQPEKKAQAQTTDTEELTEEEMKQLDDLLKRLEALEARIAKLESGSAAAPNAKPGKLTVVAKYVATSPINYFFTNTETLSFAIFLQTNFSLEHSYNVEPLRKIACMREEILNKDYSHAIHWSKIDAPFIVELSDGNFYKLSRVGDTLREIKAFATLIGHKIPEKAKADVLAAEIVREHGADGWCFYDGQALNSHGVVYGYEKISKQDLITYINKACGTYSFIMQKPETNGKSERELIEAYMDMINNATPRPLPDNDEILRQFDEALRIEKLKCKQ